MSGQENVELPESAESSEAVREYVGTLDVAMTIETGARARILVTEEAQALYGLEPLMPDVVVDGRSTADDDLLIEVVLASPDEIDGLIMSSERTKEAFQDERLSVTPDDETQPSRSVGLVLAHQSRLEPVRILTGMRVNAALLDAGAREAFRQQAAQDTILDPGEIEIDEERDAQAIANIRSDLVCNGLTKVIANGEPVEALHEVLSNRSRSEALRWAKRAHLVGIAAVLLTATTLYYTDRRIDSDEIGALALAFGASIGANGLAYRQLIAAQGYSAEVARRNQALQTVRAAAEAIHQTFSRSYFESTMSAQLDQVSDDTDDTHEDK